MSEDRPHQGHRDRMRQKFADSGSFSGFAEHEILEMLLFYIYPRCNTNVIAHDLVDEFGSVKGVLAASPEALGKVRGVGEKCAGALGFFGALLSHVQSEDFTGVNAGDFRDVQDFIERQFRFDSEEKLKMYCVTGSGRITNAFTVGRGDCGKVDLDIRRLGLLAVMTECESVLLAHNHPEGDCKPSQHDIVTTRMITNQLSALNIRLFDHCIAGRDGVLSMRARGLINDLY
ncbi:MAG: RadC family protein [Ruminococcus sp.]|nr:RadC family protein [Ruminococcus sp.]